MDALMWLLWLSPSLCDTCGTNHHWYEIFSISLLFSYKFCMHKALFSHASLHVLYMHVCTVSVLLEVCLLIEKL